MDRRNSFLLTALSKRTEELNNANAVVVTVEQRVRQLLGSKREADLVEKNKTNDIEQPCSNLSDEINTIDSEIEAKMLSLLNIFATIKGDLQKQIQDFTNND